MRIGLVLPLVAAVALASCGKKEEKPSGPMSASEAASAMGNLELPRAGQYKAAVELVDFQMPGMSDAQKQQMQQMFASSLAEGHTYCITQKESEEGAKDMAKKLAEGDCTFNEFKASGNTLSADMICKDEKGAQGHVKLDGTTSKEGSDMTMEMTQPMGGTPAKGDMHMKMHMVSKRIGDCPAGTKD